MTDLTGKGLSDTIKRLLKENNLDIRNVVGQGYDGAAAMSGTKSGVQKHINDEVSTALYVHCCSHNLNLCLEKAGKVPEIQSCVVTMREIIVFFRESPKRSKYLHDIAMEITQAASDEGGSQANTAGSQRNLRLKKFCPTRWVESQESTQFFVEMYPVIKQPIIGYVLDF